MFLLKLQEFMFENREYVTFPVGLCGFETNLLKKFIRIPSNPTLFKITLSSFRVLTYKDERADRQYVTSMLIAPLKIHFPKSLQFRLHLGHVCATESCQMLHITKHTFALHVSVCTSSCS